MQSISHFFILVDLMDGISTEQKMGCMVTPPPVLNIVLSPETLIITQDV